MKRLRRWWTRPARRRWDEDLVWYRLRYREAGGVTRCLQRLAQTGAGGRVALCWQPGATARLHVGVPRAYGWLLTQMAADFGFALREDTPAAPETPLAAVEKLPWERPFVAHLAAGRLFVSDAAAVSYFPTAATEEATVWTLPVEPPVGVGLDGVWPQTAPPAAWTADGPDRSRWLLGHLLTAPDQMLAAPGAVNVYGEQAVAWLAPQMVQALAADHRGLVILDGCGDLARQLKRSATVTRLLGKGLRYVHLAGPSLAEGFDPLASVPGEDAAVQRRRRRNWFSLMGIHRAGLALLEDAPLVPLPALHKWLAAPAQQRQGVGAAALGRGIERLLTDPRLRRWLEWPVNHFEGLPDEALILAFPGDGWAQRQLLLAALLAACACPGVRLVAHGLPWSLLAAADGRLTVPLPAQTVVANGPRLPQSVPVLTGGAADAATPDPRPFLGDDPTLVDALHLLPPGVGVVCHETGLCLTGWSPAAGAGPAESITTTDK